MRVLVVAGLFPPLKGARAEQASRLVGALRAQGVDVRVCHVAQTETSIRRRWGRFTGKVGAKFVGYATKIAVGLNSARLVHRIQPWGMSAREADWRPDIVFSLSTPVESHVVGGYLARKYGCKWSVFFSDPWPLGLGPAPYRNASALDAWVKRGLRRSLAGASLVIAPTQEVAKIMADNYFSDEEVATLEVLHCAPARRTDNGPSPSRSGLLVHAGDLTRERCSLEFLEGVKQACHSIPCGQPLFHFIGAVDSSFTSALQHEINSGAIRLTKRMPIEQCLMECARASAVLVVEADMANSPFLPSKIADYSSLGVPVLAITNSDSALVRICGASVGFRWVEHERESIRMECLEIIKSAWADAFYSPCLTADAVASRALTEFRKLLAGQT